MATDETSYKNACEVCVPIVLKIPICVEPEVIAKPPECKNGHNPYSQPIPATAQA